MSRSSSLRSPACRAWLHRISLIAVWFAALFGALSLHRLRTDYTSAACRPWGCTPPLEALVACHLAWFIALLPLVWLAKRSWSETAVARFGLVLLAFSGGGTLLFVAIALATESVQSTAYLPQRIALRTIGFTDLPLWPSMVLGAWAWVSSRPGRDALPGTGETP